MPCGGGFGKPWAGAIQQIVDAVRRAMAITPRSCASDIVDRLASSLTGGGALIRGLEHSTRPGDRLARFTWMRIRSPASCAARVVSSFGLSRNTRSVLSLLGMFPVVSQRLQSAGHPRCFIGLRSPLR
jgi:hypothetical protein